LRAKRDMERERKIPHEEDIEDMDWNSKGELAYLESISQNDVEWDKVGHTGNWPQRATNLRFRYPGKHKVLHQKAMKHPSAQEECYKRLREKDSLTCTEPPCPKEIFYKDAVRRELAWQICSTAQDDILKEYERKIALLDSPKSAQRPEGKQGFQMKMKGGIIRRL
jgi:hypothetical protein